MTVTTVLDSYWNDWDDDWEDVDPFVEEADELSLVEDREIIKSYARSTTGDFTYDFDPEDYPYGWTAEPF